MNYTYKIASRSWTRWLAGLAVLSVIAVFVSGCQSTPEYEAIVSKSAAASKPDKLVLREGDTVRITFPGATELNTGQQIRRDGTVTLPLVGEFKAAGLTPPEMEKELLKVYGPQLVTKQVTVTVEASAFPVFVTGCVVRPGRITSDHPMTALEAIMEAGGFDYAKANLKAVSVLRTEKGRTQNYKLNLKRVIEGQDSQQFYLKPSDIVYVPERWIWF
jgi:polysaccharide export outer membrane protein